MRVTPFNDFVSDFSKFYILILLYNGPLHGYQLIQEFKKKVGKDISPSLVYPFLQQIEKREFVTSTNLKIGANEKKVYELTRKGRDLCSRFFRHFSTFISIAIEPSLEVCAHCGCKVYEGGYTEVINGKDLAFCCKHCANSYKKEIGIHLNHPFPQAKSQTR